MTGTTKASKNSASVSSRKTAKHAAAKTASPSRASRKATKPDKDVTEVAELTAADLAGPQEQEVAKTPPVSAPAAAEEKMAAPVTASAVAEKAEKVVQKGKEAMSDVLETTKKYADETKERFQTVFAELSEKAKAGVEKSTKAFEEAGDLAKGNVEALIESGKIASKGVETLGQEAAEYSRASFEKASATLKNLSAVKSPAEFFQLQSELASSSFDSFVKESAKASEAWLKLAGDVVKPISTRVSVVTEKVRSITS